MHAVATTPAEPLGASVVRLPQQRRPSPRSSRVGFRIALFEACSAFTHVTACMLAKSPEVTLYTGVLQPLRYLHDRSDCYRLERQVAGRESHPLKMHTFARHTATPALLLSSANEAVVRLAANLFLYVIRGKRSS